MICRCSHPEELHGFGRHPKTKQRVRMACTAQDESFHFCKCEEFHEAKSEEEVVMATKKAARKKSEGRVPTLAPYADTIGGKTIYMNHDGKEHTATVLSSGVIRMDEKDYTSPSSAGSAILGKDKKGKPRQIDGWKSWYFNKDGDRVMLNTLRGSKSPLSIEAPKPRKAKSANGAARKTRKRASGSSAAKAAKPQSSSTAVKEAVA